jgi:hypothetical protein
VRFRLFHEGVPPDEAARRVGMVVEGMYTTEAALCPLSVNNNGFFMRIVMPRSRFN